MIDATLYDVGHAAAHISTLEDGHQVVVVMLMTDGSTIRLAGPTLDDLRSWWHDVGRGLNLARKAGL